MYCFPRDLEIPGLELFFSPGCWLVCVLEKSGRVRTDSAEFPFKWVTDILHRPGSRQDALAWVQLLLWTQKDVLEGLVGS